MPIVTGLKRLTRNRQKTKEDQDLIPMELSKQKSSKKPRKKLKITS